MQLSDSLGTMFLAKQLGSLCCAGLHVDHEPLGVAAEVENVGLIVRSAASVVGFGLGVLLDPPWARLLALPIPAIIGTPSRSPPILAAKSLALESTIGREVSLSDTTGFD